MLRGEIPISWFLDTKPHTVCGFSASVILARDRQGGGLNIQHGWSSQAQPPIFRMDLAQRRTRPAVAGC